MADEAIKNMSIAEEIGKNQYKPLVDLLLVKMMKLLYEEQSSIVQVWKAEIFLKEGVQIFKPEE